MKEGDNLKSLDRDKFIEIFGKINEFIEDEYEIETDSIKIWHWEDETFILNKETGFIVSWYKHLGRANWCNHEMSLYEYRQFATDIMVEINKWKEDL